MFCNFCCKDTKEGRGRAGRGAKKGQYFLKKRVFCAAGRQAGPADFADDADFDSCHRFAVPRPGSPPLVPGV